METLLLAVRTPNAGARWAKTIDGAAARPRAIKQTVPLSGHCARQSDLLQPDLIWSDPIRANLAQPFFIVSLLAVMGLGILVIAQ